MDILLSRRLARVKDSSIINLKEWKSILNAYEKYGKFENFPKKIKELILDAEKDLGIKYFS